MKILKTFLEFYREEKPTEEELEAQKELDELNGITYDDEDEEEDTEE